MLQNGTTDRAVGEVKGSVRVNVNVNVKFLTTENTEVTGKTVGA